MKSEKILIHSLFSICMWCLACVPNEPPEPYGVSMSTYEYATVDGETLLLDFYAIPGMESSRTNPLILYVHGGGFSGGDRDDGNIRNFFNKAIGDGFVGASISYRLLRKGESSGFGCDCPKEEKIRVFKEVVRDINLAAQYLIDNRLKLQIDSSKIILMGSSAGAEAILHAAFSQFTKVNGPKYAGVVAMAGAISDTLHINQQTTVPTLFFHGTADPLVPYATAPHHYCTEDDKGYIILHGSASIARIFHRLNMPYWLHTTCNGGHELAGSPLVQYQEEILSFCKRFVINGDQSKVSTYVTADQIDCPHEDL